MMPHPERRGTTEQGFWSLFISLLFHGLLIFVLWCLVINVTRQESIFLIASSPRQSPEAPLDVLIQQAAEVSPTDRAETSEDVSGSQEAVNASLDALIADALRSSRTVDPAPSSEDPPSIEFFGTRAYGTRFVFLLDGSYSMDARDGARFRRARDELLRAVSELDGDQSYYVFLFSWYVAELDKGSERAYRAVREGHAQRLRKWLDDSTLGPGTDPRRALSLAREMKPDAVFLLSDGQFNQPRASWSESGWLDENANPLDFDVQQGVETFYRGIPIHTIAFENPFTRSAMEQISQSSGGSFRYVHTDSLEPIESEQFLKLWKEIDQERRDHNDPIREYQVRLSAARELISNGELLLAEYIVRPLTDADPTKILNPKLLEEVLQILHTEIGDARLEDFSLPPEIERVIYSTSSRS